MNVVYSSDENYVQHMGVSILSLLKNNQDFDKIVIYILSNGISEKSKDLLTDIVIRKFNREIFFVDFAPYKEKLHLNMEWDISISTYARLFLSEMLPLSCERVLYLDCDTVVCGSLEKLWSFEMGECSVGGVSDTVSPQFKKAVGLVENDDYINAGVLLLDLNKWRERSIQERFLQFIEEKNGRVSHHDQGTINGVLHNEICILPIEYNVMTPVFTTRYENLFDFYKITGEYYSKTEYVAAQKHPIIVHFVPEFVGRVWEKPCYHPLKSMYRYYLEQTPWKGSIKPAASKMTLKMRIIYLCNCRLPCGLQKIVVKLAQKRKTVS